MLNAIREFSATLMTTLMGEAAAPDRSSAQAPGRDSSARCRSPSQRRDHAREMAAFDRLPAVVRAALRDSPFDFSPVRLAEDKRELGLTVPQTLAFIAELEHWARGELARAACTGDGNRLDAASEPDVMAMAARVRQG